MNLSDYMRLRNKLSTGGTTTFAMSTREFSILGIKKVKGWPKQYKDLEITNEQMFMIQKNCKKKIPKRIKVIVAYR